MSKSKKQKQGRPNDSKYEKRFKLLLKAKNYQLHISTDLLITINKINQIFQQMEQHTNNNIKKKKKISKAGKKIKKPHIQNINEDKLINMEIGSLCIQNKQIISKQFVLFTEQYKFEELNVENLPQFLFTDQYELSYIIYKKLKDGNLEFISNPEILVYLAMLCLNKTNLLTYNAFKYLEEQMDQIIPAMTYGIEELQSQISDLKLHDGYRSSSTYGEEQRTVPGTSGDIGQFLGEPLFQNEERNAINEQNVIQRVVQQPRQLEQSQRQKELDIRLKELKKQLMEDFCRYIYQACHYVLFHCQVSFKND